MTEPKAIKASPRFIADLASWRARDKDILAGKTIPTPSDRRSGHSAFQGSPLLDLRQAIKIELARDQLPPDALKTLEICHDIPTAKHCWDCYQQLAAYSDIEHLYLWHAAIRGHQDAVPMLIVEALQRVQRHDRVGWMMGVSMALGMITNFGKFHPDDGLEADDLDEARAMGLARMRAFGVLVAEYDDAENESEQSDEKAESGLEAALAAFNEDRAEIKDIKSEDLGMPKPERKQEPGRIVVPGVILMRPDSSAKKENIAAVKTVAGKRLPLIGADKLVAARTALRESHPHLHAEIDRMLNLQVGRPFVHSMILLVGPAGTGKTSLATAFCDAIGLPNVLVNAGAVSDSSFGGTPAQWNSSRISVPLQLVVSGEIANPCVIVDEIDKCATGRHNGNFADSLLAFLESSSASRYLDPAIETTVDLSAVSYIATANTLEDVPVPLRDRLSIIKVPEPGWEHVGALTAKIIADIAKDRGLDPRWIPPLAPDELDVLRTGWNGGSLRQLTKMTTLMIDGREQFFGRA